MIPGHITKRSPDDVARRYARDAYLKQDVEAQLIAADLFKSKWNLAFQYLIETLEREPDPNDELEGPDDSVAKDQFKLDFHIPAVTHWVKHDGQRLYDGLAKDGFNDWHKRNIPLVARRFDRPIERWLFWEKRLVEIAQDRPDDFTEEVAVGYMQTVIKAIHRP